MGTEVMRALGMLHGIMPALMHTLILIPSTLQRLALDTEAKKGQGGQESR